MLPELPPPDDPHVRHMRRMFLAVITGSFLFLIPWIAYLSASLPTHHEVTQWRLAWVGFDGALIAAIGITALCAWRRLQIFVPWAVVTATLLCCDAWFDIVLDWSSNGLTGSVLTAALAELPLAALLLYAARKMTRLTVILAWRRAGRTEPVPPLSRLSLIVLSTEEEQHVQRSQERHDAEHRHGTDDGDGNGNGNGSAHGSSNGPRQHDDEHPRHDREHTDGTENSDDDHRPPRRPA